MNENSIIKKINEENSNNSNFYYAIEYQEI